MFTYWGFGLHIASEIEFPELLPAEFKEADVSISVGITPSALEGDGVTRRAFSYVSKDQYLLNIKKIGKYYVAFGKTVIVEPAPGIDEKSIRLFLLGTVMAAVLYQRGCIPMHASAIVKDGKLTMFAGASGAGKSTLIACLASKGYNIFTDDICVMHHNLPGQKGVFCTASYPMIKLWDDAISGLNSNLFTREFKIRPQLPKYGQFFYEQFNASTLPLEKIFILNNRSKNEGVTVKKLETIRAFKKLESQAYKPQLIAGTQMRGLHFSLLSELVNNIPVYEITRPVVGNEVGDVFDAIKTLIG